MSKRVYDALMICASHDYTTFAVPEPGEEDPPARRKDELKDLEEIRALITLGLLRDVSNNYLKEIEKYKNEYGTTYRVIELTKEGIAMFTTVEKQVIN